MPTSFGTEHFSTALFHNKKQLLSTKNKVG